MVSCATTSPVQEIRVQEYEETRLPGAGVLRTFLTATGDWIGVLELPSGRRQLFVDDPSDPDTRHLAAELHEDDCRLLVRLLGAHDPGPSPADAAPALVEWVLLPPDSGAAGLTIGSLGLRSRTGATIAAVLRDRTYSDLGPDFLLQGGDIVLLTGGQPALASAATLLREST
jgi:TrkA domain protein